MISVLTLERLLKKSNPNLWIYFNSNSKYDVLPARLYHNKTELISVPKGLIYRKTYKDTDGSIAHRGWQEIVKLLCEYRLIADRHKLIGYLERAESGMVV